jgi:dTDP-4-amino-4,6-dideoxygalactose transaminase
LRAAGLGVNVHYIPVYKHPYYQNNGYADVCCPNAEALYNRLLSLPMYPSLTDDEIEYVINAVKGL